MESHEKEEETSKIEKKLEYIMIGDRAPHNGPMLSSVREH